MKEIGTNLDSDSYYTNLEIGYVNEEKRGILLSTLNVPKGHIRIEIGQNSTLLTLRQARVLYDCLGTLLPN